MAFRPSSPGIAILSGTLACPFAPCSFGALHHGGTKPAPVRCIELCHVQRSRCCALSDEMRVIANRTVNLPWSKGNRTTITSIAISDQSPIDLTGLGLAIEFCIDRLSEQADVVSQHVRSEVAYV